MHELTCLECGIVFQSPNPQRKCCSPTCASIAGTKKRTRKVSVTCPVCSKTELKSPSHAHHKYCSLECKGIASRKPEIVKQCLTCGRPFVVPTKHPQQEFCSNECSFTSRREKPDYICEVCGKNFRRSGTREFRHCSIECMAIGYRKPIEERDCAYCGKPFLSKKRTTRHCSPSCTAKAGKAHRIKLVLCTCANCGKQEYRSVGKKRKYCSDACKEHARQHRITLHHFTFSQKREIKIRDGHTCVHCGAKERLQVDHILAIGLGGTNDLLNGQTLCYPCHVKKTTQDRAMIRKSKGLGAA